MMDESRKNGGWRDGFGMSTDVEFQKLLEAYPNPQIGDRYTDEEISNVIGVEPVVSRYKSVVGRWYRHLMRTSNLLLVRITCVGYEIADADKRLDYAVDRDERANRQKKKALAVLGSTERTEVSPEKRPVYDHKMNYLTRHMQAQVEEKRTLRMLPPESVEQKDG